METQIVNADLSQTWLCSHRPLKPAAVTLTGYTWFQFCVHSSASSSIDQSNSWNSTTLRESTSISSADDSHQQLSQRHHGLGGERLCISVNPNTKTFTHASRSALAVMKRRVKELKGGRCGLNRPLIWTDEPGDAAGSTARAEVTEKTIWYSLSFHC